MLNQGTSHSSVMNARILVGLALSATLIACTARTTSLGGPSGNNASASSAEQEDDASERAGGGELEHDGGLIGCAGYTWMPAPSATPCEYHLPSEPPKNEDPLLDPTQWGPDPAHVTVMTITMGERNDGLFVGSSDGCGAGDGWYYVEPGDGGVPSLFAICPKTCAAVTNGALLRITAMKSIPCQ